jgi:hypothetical protein
MHFCNIFVLPLMDMYAYFLILLLVTSKCSTYLSSSKYSTQLLCLLFVVSIEQLPVLLAYLQLSTYDSPTNCFNCLSGLLLLNVNSASLALVSLPQSANVLFLLLHLLNSSACVSNLSKYSVSIS